MADLASTGLSADFVATLADAAVDQRDKMSVRPSTKTVVNALLQAEKAAKQQSHTYAPELLLGDWRLCFTARRQAHLKGSTALGKGFYIPKILKAQICFGTPGATAPQTLSQLEIGNSLQCGSLVFKLTGPARYLGKKNLLAFDFTQMQLRLFGRPIYSGEFRRSSKAKATDFNAQSITRLPFFAFFLITEDFIAARGRGGGLALWAKLA